MILRMLVEDGLSCLGEYGTIVSAWRMGGELLEETRWQHGMGEFRAVQDLVRGGRYQEAIERALAAIHGGGLGRRYAARLHGLLCWLHVSALEAPSPAAVLHGEEALRLADLINDEWIRSEALIRLIPAYCQIGDLDRAEQACERLGHEVERNEMVISAGWSGFWSIRAEVALAAGDPEQAIRFLARAEESADPNTPAAADRIRRQRAAVEAWGQLGPGELTESIQQVLRVELHGESDRALLIRSSAAEALLMAKSDGVTAAARAREALNRAIALGRADLARQVRWRLAHLL